MTDPYKIQGPALIAFSGGRTSAFMLWNIMQAHGGRLPDDVIPTFCNTGLEHPATYEFIERIMQEWNAPVRWLEYRVPKSFVQVTPSTASKNGEPFKELIEKRKYLPNRITRFCTTELKIRTMSRFASSIWDEQPYSEVVGLRYDEPRRVHRIKADKSRNDVLCPMYAAKHSVTDVEAFWAKQPFKLEIPHYLGNCVGCFLKGKRKLTEIAYRHPEYLAWWNEQEQASKQWMSEGVTENEAFCKKYSYAELLSSTKGQCALGFEADDDLPCDCTE